MQAYEKDLSMLREGVTVTIRTEAYPEKAFKGKIDFLGSMVDSATRTIQLRATVSNADEKLRPGMFVKAHVDVPEASEGKSVVVVPQAALQTLEGRTVVFVQTETGTFVRRLVDFTPRDVLERIAGRVAKLGWHIVVYFEMPDLPDLEPFFTGLPTTVVVDHMGTPDVKKGVDHPENQRFHRLMEKHPNFWVKVTCPERLSVAGPPYDDVVPFARALVERFPDRVLWGTDWPHPNMRKEAPDDGLLTDRIPHIAPTALLQRRLLIDNPMRLYWGR